MTNLDGSSLTSRAPAWAEPAVAFVRRAPDLVALLAMAFAGFCISVYLTSVHYTKVPLVCNTTGVIDCAAVTSSKYSLVPGTQLPITIPGLLWFVVSGALAGVALAALLRGQAEPPRLRLAQAIWGGLGMAFVLYLVFAEIVLLHRICEWCTVVHLLTLATFLVALNRLQRSQAGESADASLGAQAASVRPSATRARTAPHRSVPHGSVAPGSRGAARSGRSGGAHGSTTAKSRRR